MSELASKRRSPKSQERSPIVHGQRSDKQKTSRESTAIQDRIRQWQAQGAAQAHDPDAVSVRSFPQPDVTREQRACRELEDTQRAPHNRTSQWVHRGDQQWTRERRRSQKQTTKTDDNKLGLNLGRLFQGAAPTPTKGESLKQVRDKSSHARNVDSSRAEREERRRRRREARVRVSAEYDRFCDGIEAFTRPKPPLVSERSLDDVCTDTKIDEIESFIGSLRDRDASATRSHTELDFIDNDLPVPRSKYADTLGCRNLIDRDETRHRKNVIFGRTKEILIGRNSHTTATANRVPSIQAWLEDQPDLKTGEGVAEVLDAYAPVKAPKSAGANKKRRSSNLNTVGDPNRIWEAVSVPQTADSPDGGKASRAMRREQRRVSRVKANPQLSEHRQFSFEVPESAEKGEVIASILDHPSQAQNTTTLRRKGAKSSRDKGFVTLTSARSKVNDSEQLTAVHASSVAAHGATELETKPTPSASLSNLMHDGSNNGCAPQTDADAGIKRKLTTHDDLLSVLSLPQARKVARPVRSHRDLTNTRSKQQALDELLFSMQQEEVKYTRELRTLVEGVTPVLLDSLLSKKSAVTAANLFSDSVPYGTNLTRSLIDMATAVEQLKTLHGKMPLQDINSLLSWGLRAHFVYSKYVKAWRLGFQGVIVNLAPLSDSEVTTTDLLGRDLDGDVVDATGEKIDVAYLQKRPLVRVKKLSKLYTTILDAYVDNEQAPRVAAMFADLTELAKRRHNDELGRIEDETAARVDVSRARDIKNLAPTTNVHIDQARKVRARDPFDMTIYHSTGQRMDCRVELVLRDDTKEDHHGGDVLICQQEGEGKWLLFAPISLSKISARRGESVNDLVVMIRGAATITQEWSELLALTSHEPGAVTDWIHMLGSSPLPPKLNKTPAFANRPSMPESADRSAVILSAASSTPVSASALASLPTTADIPIGEPSEIGRHRASGRTRQTSSTEQKQPARALPTLSLGGGLAKKSVVEHHQKGLIATTSSQAHLTRLVTAHPSGQLTVPEFTAKQPVLSDAPSVKISPSSIPHAASSGHSADTASSQRYVPQEPRKRSSVVIGSPAVLHETTRLLEEPVTISQPAQSKANKARERFERLEQKRLDERRETPTRSSTAMIETGEDAALQHRPHRPSQIGSPYSTSLTNAIRDQWTVMSGGRKQDGQLVRSSLPSGMRHTRATDPRPTGSSSAVSKVSTAFSSVVIGQRSGDSLPDLPQLANQHRPSLALPLARERDIASSDSESRSSSDDETDATSEMSDADGSELKDQFTPLVSVGNVKLLPRPDRPLPSLPTSGTRTLQPSDSASQGPYRRVPPPSAHPASKKRKTIATVCSWSEKGIWQPIQDDECSVMVAPGLIQIFAMTEEHSRPMSGPDWHGDEAGLSKKPKPLVEYELTPIVPLRRGTALDITIRSPPTGNSQLQTTSNVMFRSRSVEECEKLYNMINWARCNNPTYASLARARAAQPRVTFAVEVSPSKSRSWFSFGSRGRGYRASSKPPSTMGDTVRSDASAASAFSALRRFGQNSPFSLKRSSVIHKPSTGGLESLYSSGSGTQPNSGSSTPVPSQAGYIPGKDGPNVPQTSAEAVNGGGMVNQMKIRLFSRRGQAWEAMGQCGLTVLPAVVKSATASRPGSAHGSPTSTPPRSSAAPNTMPPSAMRPSAQFRLASSSNTPHRIHGDGREKRVLITKWKKPDVVMLDEMLGETCFEKVMQTGIAVKVWKEDEHVRDIGGVMNGRNTTYMMQFMTSAEAEWVFGMVGTYRYGNVSGS